MSIEQVKPMIITPVRYVLPPVASFMTGYSVKAIEHKMRRGEWEEGKVWRRAPDGRVVIDLDGYEKWVESGRTST